MKHSFKLVDKLNDLVHYLPRDVSTNEQKIKAKEHLLEIHTYIHILKTLVENHQTKEYLKRLHSSHITEIEGWVNHVTAVFQKFDQLLINLNKDITTMEGFLENDSSKWHNYILYIAQGMIMTGLHDEEEEIERFRKIAIFEEHELRTILDSEDHVIKLLK